MELKIKQYTEKEEIENSNRCKWCNEVIMGDFHKQDDCAMNPSNKHDEGCLDSNVDKEIPECICENKK